jgi:hypothetical protein
MFTDVSEVPAASIFWVMAYKATILTNAAVGT